MLNFFCLFIQNFEGRKDSQMLSIELRRNPSTHDYNYFEYTNSGNFSKKNFFYLNKRDFRLIEFVLDGKQYLIRNF